MEKINNKWDIWFHSINDSNWKKDSYQKIFSIENLLDYKYLIDTYQQNHYQNGMFFCMKEDIFPNWEDPDNRNGGCLSFKIPSVKIIEGWNDLLLRCIKEIILEDNNDEIKLSSLIQPNFSFTYDLIECELNKNSSLLDLEFFFSKNIDKYKAITDGKIRLSILFPENKINVSGFIIAIKSNTDYGNLESFISQIQRDQFNDIALCKFIINQNKGFNILEYKNNSNLDYEFVEILICQYKEVSM